MALVVTWAWDTNTILALIRPPNQTWLLTAAWVWMSPWPQMAAQATQISMAPCCMALRHPHGLLWQPKPWITARPLVVTQAKEIDTDLSCSRTTDPDMAFGDSPSQDTTMASGLHSLLIPSCSLPPSNLQVHLSPQGTKPSAPLSFLCLHCILHLSHHLSKTCLPVVVAPAAGTWVAFFRPPILSW